MKFKIQSMMKRLVVLMFCLCLISPSAGMIVSAEEKLPGGTHTYVINDEEQSYQSLKEAVSQAESGATIKLTEDESIVKTDNTPQDYGEQIVVKGKSITIDLAGHTIKNNNTHPNYTGHAAIRVDAGGNLTIRDTGEGKSGAVVGINDASHGGAVITVVGGSLTLEGGTITGNTTTAQGGGVFVKNGTLTVKDGAVITGNTAAEGGGVYATGSSTVNIYGGEISHNTATSTVMDRGGITPQGGGGIAAVGSVNLTMSGGVICDNTAAGAGGGIGIRRSEGTETPVFTMTGGAITRNTAEAHEGGGIRLEGTGTINPTDGKIEITGNICNTESDLGGGGIFVSTESSLTMRNAVITENSAGGLGGGLAGCIYGEISNLSTDGAAIYGNTAKGENFTTSESGRADRREVLKKALQDGTVTAADAQDFFSAGDIDNGASGKGESVVSDLMPGGGSHRWSGVDGGKAVTVGLGSAYYSDDYLVLTSHPTDADIAKQGSISGNIIDISLNYTHNHGGGVAANGVLMLGTQEDSYNVVDGAWLNVTKAMKQVNTATGAVTDLTDCLDGYTFELVNESGETVASAVTDTDGNAEITIPANLFDAGRTEYSFILRERAGNEDSIVYDDSTYEVTITLTPESEETVLIGTQSITIHRFGCDIKIKNDDGSELQNGTAPVFTNTVKYTPPETPSEEPNDKPNEKPDKPVEVSGDSPQTGDTTGIFIWIGLLTASLTGCITIILFSKRKRYNTKRIR